MGVLWLWRKTRQTEPDTKPTSRQISKAIRSAPPLVQQEVAERYTGIEVSWRLAYSSASPNGNGRVQGSLEQRTGFPWPSVECEVVLADYPLLKTIAGKTKIRVTGRIKRARFSQINLTDAKLHFYE